MRQPVPFGKYLLLDRISVGGMAEVFKAKSYGVEGFEKIIAIKRILPTMGEDRDFIKMFIDEAKIAGQLAHANICQIFELGRIDGSHFIAMEYIWGKDLLQIQNRLRKLKQPMPVPMACFIIAKGLEGLDYAHRKRDPLGRPLEIVHRDCSPQNVLVSYEGEVKVIDFGIAKATSRNSRTMAGVLKGKFGYMSPEQVRGLPLDRRSDIFALGTMLYECLTSERLFQGETDFSTLEKVRNVDIRPPREVNPAIPEHVERVILKALAKDVDDRYQWCSEMLADIQQFLMSQDVVFTAKSLSSWLKEGFSPEIDRERQQLESYKRVGRDGLIQGVPAAEAKVDVVASLGEAGAPEGDATQLGGPNFEDMDSVPTTPPSGGSGGVAGNSSGTPPGVQLGKPGAPNPAAAMNPVGHHTPPPAVNGGPKPLGKPNSPMAPMVAPPAPAPAPPARRARTNDDDDGFGEEAPTEIFGDTDNGSKPNPGLQLGQPGAPLAPPKKPSGTPGPVLQQPPQPPKRTTSPQGVNVGAAGGPSERRTPPPERDNRPANPTMPLNPSAGMMPSGQGQTSPPPPLATAPTAISPMLSAQGQPQNTPPPLADYGYNPYGQPDPQMQQQPQYDAYGQPMMAMGTPGAVPMMGQPSKTMLGQAAPPGLGQYRPTTQPGTQAPPQNQSGSVPAMPYGQPMPTPQQQPIANPYGYSQQYSQPLAQAQQQHYPQAQQPMHPSQQHMAYNQPGMQGMQPGMQGMQYPSQPMMQGYPMAPQQMSQPMSSVPPLDEVAPPEGRKKSTLARDIIIGVLIASLVVAGFLVVKFVVLDSDDSSSTDTASSTIASVKLELPSGVTAAVYVDDKKDPEFKAVADGQTLPIAAGKRKIRIEAQQGTCEREVDLPGGEITELKCPLAGGSDGGGSSSGGAGSAGAGTGSSGGGAGSATAKTPVTPASAGSGGAGSGSAATEVADNTSKKPPDTNTTKKPPDTTNQVKPPDTNTTKKPPDGPVLPKEDKGWLNVTCKPPAKIIVDGAATGMTTPISGHALALTPGKHKITFAIGEDRYSFWVTITAGQSTPLTKDFGQQ